MYVCFVLTAKQLSNWTTDLETHTFCRVIFLERVKREEMRGGGVSRRWKIVAACCLCQKRQASSTARIPAHTTMIPAGFSCKDSVFFYLLFFPPFQCERDRWVIGCQLARSFLLLSLLHTEGKKSLEWGGKTGLQKKFNPTSGWLIFGGRSD